MRIVICDDHRLLLEGMASAMAARGYVVEAATCTPDDAVIAVRLHDPDALLIDLTFPEGDGLTAAREVVTKHPRTKVVVLTASDANEHLRVALEIGVAGYVRKDQRLEGIVSALERARRGERAVDGSLVRRLGRDAPATRQRGALDDFT